MLAALKVSNLAVVESACVEFQPGVNVITGETGAGKSLLIGALNLILGERADRRLVRAGAEQAEVEGVFQLRQDTEIADILAAAGVPAAGDGALYLKRIILRDGGSRQFVNQSAVALQFLKQLGDCLVDLHGPHEHQLLLQPRAQLDLLDAYGKLQPLRARYLEAYRRCEALRQEEQMLSLPAGAAGDMEWLAAQVRELTEANLSAAEEQALQENHKLLGNAQRALELAGQIEQALAGDEGGALAALAGALKNLEALGRLASLPPHWLENLQMMLAQLRDLHREIGGWISRVDTDPARLAQLEQRLALYQKMKMKYGGSVAAALERLAALRADLDRAAHRGERLAKLAREIQIAEAAMQEAGLRLRAERAKTASRLAKAVGAELAALFGEAAVFDVKLTEAPPGPAGMDAVEFMFSANAGEVPQDLRRVASSGEISRLMLALKSAAAGNDRVPVLVFDEIDVNLGGAAADVVGEKLRELGRHHQVLCISHLAQVAAMADRHIVVRKSVRAKRSTTAAFVLDNEARVAEIARMLSGKRITAAVLQHAREMLAGRMSIQRSRCKS